MLFSARFSSRSCVIAAIGPRSVIWLRDKSSDSTEENRDMPLIVCKLFPDRLSRGSASPYLVTIAATSSSVR
jgi:hypothetical protein